MPNKSSWSSAPIVLLLRPLLISLSLIAASAYLTACANWQQAFDELKDKEVQITAAETKARDLPDVPKEIQDCLDKNACAAAKKDEVAKACRTADGIVLEQKKVIKELKSCGKTLLDWYSKVKAAEAAKGDQKQAAAEATGHPRSASPQKKRDADWP